MGATDLVFLVGNSSVHWGACASGGVVRSGRLAWTRVAAEGARALLDEAGRGEAGEPSFRAPFRRLVAASVRDDRLEVLERGFEGVGPSLPPLLVAGRDFAVPVVNRYRDPSEAGIDRLLNALGAARRWPGRSAIVLDFGTALSVTVVGADGAFLGGLIALGPGAASEALSSAAPRLPRVDLEPARSFLQRTTESAIRAGLFWQLAGGVERILEGLRCELGDRPLCAATGGAAPLLAGAVRGIDQVVPDLALEGLLAAVGPEPSQGPEGGPGGGRAREDRG